MKRALLFTLALSLAVVSCETAGGDDDLNNDKVENQEDNGIALPDDGVEMMLSDFSAENYPTDSDNWVIVDATAKSEDFDGLQDAFSTLAESGRSISLYFTKLAAFPKEALEAAYYETPVLTAVYASVATEVGDYAFERQAALTTIDFPAATTIGGYTFQSCGLVEVNLPAVTTIGREGFACNPTLKTLESLSAATDIGESAFLGVGVTELKLPAATTIGNSAFDNSSVVTVELPEATTVDDYAFSCCYDLISVSLPKVTSIGDYAFGSCTPLKRVEIATESKLTSVGAGLFFRLPIEAIDLVIGADNDQIDTDAKSWRTWTFNSITVVGKPVQ